MRYHQLGHSDISVSEISLGCMSIGTSHHTGISLIRRAIDLGITYFDTADLYDKGENEIILGKALKGIRNDVVIGSKVGNQWRADGSGWDWNPSKAYIKESVFGSLKRLQTDYLDLYQLHGGTIEDPIEETIEAFEELKQEGWIREYGISSIRPNVIREYIRRSSIVSVMTQYSLLDRRPEEETLDALAEAGISVVVRGAVAKGYLLNKRPRSYLGHSESILQQLQLDLARFCGESITPAQAAIRYSLSHPAVATVAVGASSVEQLEENVQAGEIPPLREEELELMRGLVDAKTYENHR